MSDKNMFNLKLEMYLLDELPAAEKKQIEAELGHNADLRAQLEKLRGDTAAYYAKYPRLNLPQRKTWWGERKIQILAGALTLATAAILVAVLLPRPNDEPRPEAKKSKSGDDQTLLALNHSATGGDRSKGMQPGLYLNVLREGKWTELHDGAQISYNEEIVVAYRASGYRYGVIVSVDNARSVTLHFPETTTGSQQLERGSARLKMAFRPDEKPGFEKFYFVASAKPLSVRHIEQELQKTGTLKSAPGADTRIASISLTKQ